MSVPPNSTGSLLPPPQVTSAPTVPPPTAAKRKFDEIIASMPQNKRALTKKRAKRDTMETKSALDKLVSIARYFVRAVNPYMDVGLALFYGSLAHWGPAEAPDPTNAVSVPESERVEQQKHAKAFDKMLAKSPGSLDIMHEFNKEEEQWVQLVSMFREAASGARQNDTSGLKHKPHYILPIPHVDSLVPKIPETVTKSNRGLNHPMLRDALIPWPLRLQIHAKAALPADAPEDAEPAPTPEATAALKALMKGKTIDKKPALTGKVQYEYPSCFYAEGTFDATDPEKGLFRSHFILRILRHIWTAPASALHGVKKPPKICNARAHGQFSITPEMLGYACGQARTLLSTSDWTIKDGSYDYEAMFNNIVLLFEADPTDPWAVETLEWLTKGVFGGGDASDDENGSGSDNDEDFVLLRSRASTSAFIIEAANAVLTLALLAVLRFCLLCACFLDHRLIAQKIICICTHPCMESGT
ncbi:hypothetical protein B0H12DRAFT_1241080 [Mycena haematopus]|nr:hypothetical protein B0H12DRAFT_1241080 [Mycena haematopus]